MDSRLVECQDCGYRWESGAENPRCSKSDCGRSRNVEAVADDLDDEDDEDGDRLDPQDEQNQADDDLDDEDDAVEDDDGSGYTPAFETTTTRTDTDRSTSTTTSTNSTDDEDEDDQDEDDDGSDQEPDGPDELPEIDPETLEPALEATFNLMAVNRGEHWELKDGQAEQLAEGWCPVINHYAPYFLRQYTELGAAVIVTYTVVGPRLAEDKKLAELEKKASEDTDASGQVREQRVEDEDDGIDLDVDQDEQTPAAEAGEDNIGGYASV